MRDITSMLGQGGETSQPLKILAILTLLSLLPAIVLTMTSFVRISVVLSFLRQGLGTQQSPPTQVLVGLSIFLTLFSMAPVLRDIQKSAVDPYLAGSMSDVQAAQQSVT